MKILVMALPIVLAACSVTPSNQNSQSLSEKNIRPVFHPEELTFVDAGEVCERNQMKLGEDDQIVDFLYSFKGKKDYSLWSIHTYENNEGALQVLVIDTHRQDWYESSELVRRSFVCF